MIEIICAVIAILALAVLFIAPVREWVTPLLWPGDQLLGVWTSPTFDIVISKESNSYYMVTCEELMPITFDNSTSGYAMKGTRKVPFSYVDGTLRVADNRFTRSTLPVQCPEVSRTMLRALAAEKKLEAETASRGAMEAALASEQAIRAELQTDYDWSQQVMKDDQELIASLKVLREQDRLIGAWISPRSSAVISQISSGYLVRMRHRDAIELRFDQGSDTQGLAYELYNSNSTGTKFTVTDAQITIDAPFSLKFVRIAVPADLLVGAWVYNGSMMAITKAVDGSYVSNDAYKTFSAPLGDELRGNYFENGVLVGSWWTDRSFTKLNISRGSVQATAPTVGQVSRFADIAVMSDVTAVQEPTATLIGMGVATSVEIWT
jgi:hypothetical protein